MKRWVVLACLLLSALPAHAQQAPPYVQAVRGSAGVVLVWSRPAEQWGCIKFTGVDVDAYLENGCGPNGARILDAGQTQYAGVGRMVGLWGSSGEWITGPIPVPGFQQVLPMIAGP